MAELTRSRFPTFRSPITAGGGTEAGGVDRPAQLEARLTGLDAHDRARTLIDLTVVSVLLDAGAGPTVRESSPDGDRIYPGRKVWVWRAGTRSSPERSRRPPDTALRVDAAGLRALTAEQLAAAFQVGADNPLVGLDGRLDVLHRLGDVLPTRTSSARRPSGRPPQGDHHGRAGDRRDGPRCGPRSPLTHLAVGKCLHRRFRKRCGTG